MLKKIFQLMIGTIAFIVALGIGFVLVQWILIRSYSYFKIGSRSETIEEIQQVVLTEDVAIKTVINGEQERLPLTIQKLEDVESIMIDSLHLTGKSEPMNGFLYTTWKYKIRVFHIPQNKIEKRTKKILVPVSDIHYSEGEDNLIEDIVFKHVRKNNVAWIADWDEAYDVIRDERLK